MERVQLFSIYDSVAGKYSMPMAFENENCARRYFANIMRENPDSQDYEMFLLAEYDTKEGIVYNYDTLKSIMKGVKNSEIPK